MIKAITKPHFSALEAFGIALGAGLFADGRFGLGILIIAAVTLINAYLHSRQP